MPTYTTPEPIEKPEQDELNFLSRAKDLSEEICKHIASPAGSEPNYSLVLNISGPWGSGKSSLWNLTAQINLYKPGHCCLEALL